jgi:energy-coupling factor transport system substrate-specific component
MDTDYVMNEMKNGRGPQFDPDALDAFLRLVDKGVIDLDKIYAEKSAEVIAVDKKTQEELDRRNREDKEIQAGKMHTGGADGANGGKEGSGGPGGASADEKGGKV